MLQSTGISKKRPRSSVADKRGDTCSRAKTTSIPSSAAAKKTTMPLLSHTGAADECSGSAAWRIWKPPTDPSAPAACRASWLWTARIVRASAPCSRSRANSASALRRASVDACCSICRSIVIRAFATPSALAVAAACVGPLAVIVMTFAFGSIEERTTVRNWSTVMPSSRFAAYDKTFVVLVSKLTVARRRAAVVESTAGAVLSVSPARIVVDAAYVDDD